MKEYNYDPLTLEDCEVIDQFLERYRTKAEIVADSVREHVYFVPLGDKNIHFSIDKRKKKEIGFCQKIQYRGKFYIVRLELENLVGYSRNLEIGKFSLKKDKGTKIVFLDMKSKFLYEMMDIFKEDKILSPLEAYGKDMYPDQIVKRMIEQQKWGLLEKGLKEKKTLENALFLLEENQGNIDYTATFGTVLYQLLDYRMRLQERGCLETFSKLDPLILKLQDTALLKVGLREQFNTTKGYPSGSSLLESKNFWFGVQESYQYTKENKKLEKESKVLRKIIRGNSI